MNNMKIKLIKRILIEKSIKMLPNSVPNVILKLTEIKK